MKETIIEFGISEAFACCQKEGRDNLHWVEAKDGEVPPAALKVCLLLQLFALFEICNCPSLPLAVLEFLLLSPLRAGFVEFSSFINFQIGYESNGDPLFVARGRVVKDSYDDNSSMSVGKMNPRYGLAYLPYGGKVQLIWCHKNSATLFQEVEVAEYEVLCLKPICDLC